MTPYQRLERFLDGEHGKSRATRDAYLADARLLLELAAGRPLDSLTSEDIRGFVRNLRSRGQEPRSIARRLSAWRGWFRLLQREMGYPTNPAQGVRAPKMAKKLPRPLGTDETAGFLDALPEDEPLGLRDKAMFELAYSSGLRVSELVGVDMTDFEENGSMLRVRGKGDRERRVPVGVRARQAVAAWCAQRQTLVDRDQQALFVSRRGRRIGVGAVQKRLADWAIKLGIHDRLHPHRLRHACASHFLQSSGDLRATQELLGHQSLASTQVYTHLDFQHLARVYDATHPRAKEKKEEQ
ncbi:tyrosine recombinase XerC [Chitinimonas lacunae]|uniref:Tyrosine recombinase XerC n=1 Tax=Chitinimonas lacunae TaxID=1963018 RepID=A0ABV8MTD4_9NEIS